MEETPQPPPPEPEYKKAGGQPIKYDDELHKKRREYERARRAKLKLAKKEDQKLIREKVRHQVLTVQYKPMEEQIEFSKALDTKRIVLFYGGIRSGKTYAGARELLKCIYKRRKTPRGLSWIVSPTFPMSQVVEKEFEEACDLGGGKSLILRKYVGNHEYLLMPNVPNGKPYRVAVKTAEHPDRLRGASLDYIWMDEAAYMDKETYRILLGRILDSQGTIFMTTTPKGMNWVYEEVYKKAGIDPRIAAIQKRTSTNIYLSPEDIEHLRGQYNVQFAKQELGAEFVAFDGLVYSNFDFNRHVIEPITNIPEGAEIVVGIDAGFKDPFVFLFCMLWKGRFYVIDEYYANMRTIESHAKAVKGHFLNPHTIRRWMDPSAAQESFDLHQLGIGSLQAKNDIRAGINAVARMIELDRLFITKNCINTLREIGQYQYKERDGRNTGEEPQDVNNHCMDALRYVVYSEEGYKQNHPVAIMKDSGEMELIGLEGDPKSNKLEDWIKLKGYNPIGELGFED